MAEAVALALWEVGGVLATEAAVAILANAAAINTVATIVATTAIGQHQKRKAQAAAIAAYNASLEDRLVMLATVQGARSRVYGRVRNVDGVIYKATHGENSKFYTLVVALAAHELDAIETIYANDVPLTLDGSGYCLDAPYTNGPSRTRSTTMTVSGGAGSVVLPEDPIAGSVRAVLEVSTEGGVETFSATLTVAGRNVSTTGAPADGAYRVYWQYADARSYLRVRAYRGAAGDTLRADLLATLGAGHELTDADLFTGIPALLVTMEYSQEAFPAGVPQFSAVVRGARVHDWRTGTTAWTENPAVIARDWLRYEFGGGLGDAQINLPAFTVAANACDVSTTFPAAAGAQTRPLYQAGIAIPLDGSAPDQWLDEIVEAMAGQWCWAGGAVTLRAGAYRAPVATITEDWITSASDVVVVPQSPTEDLVNVMRPTIADAARNYVAQPVPEVRSTAMIAADGGVEWPREVTLGAVTQAVHAQHVCSVLMRQERDALTLQLPCNLRAYQLEVFDEVLVTLPHFGFEAKQFMVTGWQFSLAGGVLLDLRETPASYLVDTTLATLITSANTRLPDPAVVPQVTGVSVESAGASLVDGTLVTRARVTWTAVASQAVQQSGRIEVQYVPAIGALTDASWIAAPDAPGEATSTVIQGLQVGVHHLFRVRARNTLGVTGQWSVPFLHEVQGQRKIAVFRQAAAPAASVSQAGDLWFDTDDANKQYVYSGSAWVSVRDTGIQQALDAAAAAQAAADGKITVFYQPSTPGTADEGDLWFDTDDGNRQYVRASGVWVVAADTRIGDALTAAATAQATADGKVTTFVSATAPTADAIGDLWLDTARGNRLHRWGGGTWVELLVGALAIAPKSATETDLAEAAGPFTSTANDAEVVLTPALVCDAVVTVDMNFECTNSTGSAALIYGAFNVGYDDGTTYGAYADRFVSQVLPAGQTIRFPVSIAYRFAAVPAGVAQTWSCVYSDHVSSVLAGVVSNLRTRVELVYR